MFQILLSNVLDGSGHRAKSETPLKNLPPDHKHLNQVGQLGVGSRGEQGVLLREARRPVDLGQLGPDHPQVGDHGFAEVDCAGVGGVRLVLLWYSENF